MSTAASRAPSARNATRGPPRAKLAEADGGHVMVREVARMDGYVRKREATRTDIEDAVTGYMVDAYIGVISDFAKKIGNQLPDGDVMYVHGSGALYSMMKKPANLNAKRVLKNMPIYTNYIAPFIDAVPRDIDLCVVCEKPPKCAQVATCETFPAVKVVRAGLETLKSELQRHMKHEALIKELTDAISKDGAAYTVSLLDANDLAIEFSEADAAKVLLKEKFKPNRARQECDAGTLASGTCNPMRQSANTTISFQTLESQTSDFILLRLALVVRVSGGGLTRPMVVPANFLDVSILRAGDMAFADAGGRITLAVNADGLLPYPDLGYLLESTVKQLIWYDRERKAEATKEATDAAQLEFLNNKAAKLRKRLVAIAVINVATSNTTGLQALFRVKKEDGRVTPEVFEGFVGLCDESITDMGSSVSWWTNKGRNSNNNTVLAAFVEYAEAIFRDEKIGMQKIMVAEDETYPVPTKLATAGLRVGRPVSGMSRNPTAPKVYGGRRRV
jgi:hypothetical protein